MTSAAILKSKMATKIIWLKAIDGFQLYDKMLYLKNTFYPV